MKCKFSNILILALALTSVFMTAVIVNAKPLYGEIALDFMAPGPVHPELGIPPIWSGTITGDINGLMFFYNTGAKDVGKTHHAWEVWLITDQEYNTLLTGTDKGLVPFANNKYILNGVVTEAYGEYEHLIGRNVHMRGMVTWQNIGTPEEPELIPDTAPGVFRVN